MWVSDANWPQPLWPNPSGAETSTDVQLHFLWTVSFWDEPSGQFSAAYRIKKTLRNWWMSIDIHCHVGFTGGYEVFYEAPARGLQRCHKSLHRSWFSWFKPAAAVGMGRFLWKTYWLLQISEKHWDGWISCNSPIRLPLDQIQSTMTSSDVEFR